MPALLWRVIILFFALPVFKVLFVGGVMILCIFIVFVVEILRWMRPLFGGRVAPFSFSVWFFHPCLICCVAPESPEGGGGRKATSSTYTAHFAGTGILNCSRRLFLKKHCRL